MFLQQESVRLDKWWMDERIYLSPATRAHFPIHDKLSLMKFQFLANILAVAITKKFS